MIYCSSDEVKTYVESSLFLKPFFFVSTSRPEWNYWQSATFQLAVLMYSVQPWVTVWTLSPFWAAVNHLHKSIRCHQTGLHLPSRPCHFPVWFPAVLWLQGGWEGGVRVGGSLAQLSLLPAKAVFQCTHTYRGATPQTEPLEWETLSQSVRQSQNSPRTSHEKHAAAAEGGSISSLQAFIWWDKDSGASGDLHFSATQVITWPNNRRRSGSPFPRWMEMQQRF